MSARVMVIEDEAKIAALLRDYLEAAGYAVRVCAEGVDAVSQTLGWPADMVVLDVNLPGKDGFTICRELRAASDLPILMLTARVEEIDRVLGLELGADDYVCKPFSPREVVARVRAQLRRSQGMPGERAAAGPLRIDAAAHEALLNGSPLALTPVEFRLLKALAARPGSVLSRAQLIDAAYADHRIVSERTMDSHLKNLRRKLQEAGGEAVGIEGVYGVGYKLVLD
ncbi:response regulator [Pseudomarimonas salicorniae]|uniref:Response regulator n=1 Tax=Pseudomarimonas salicorniae TaxID=2933270 RepID=A0ABT0GM94_9GAMM|nr:response regulator [Lysobacter sp. CAU 1642]MCK7595334.1 response regulator [Lysobacter sp. CAU 1642]